MPDQHGHGLARAVGLHRRGDDVGRLVLQRIDPAVQAIGPTARLADVLVDPRQEAVPQHLIGGVQGHQVVPAGHRQDGAAQNHRLRRLRPVDQDDARLDRRQGDLEALRPACRGRGGPGAEGRVQRRQQLGERAIRDHEQPGVVRSDPGLMEGDQIVAVDRRHGPGIPGAAEGAAVGVGLAVQHDRQGAHADAVGLGHLGGDARQLLGTQALDLRRGEGRVHGHVGHQGQGGPQVGAGRGQGHDGAVHAGEGADLGAQTLLRLGQLDGVAARGALGQQLQHQGLHPKGVRRIGGVAGVELHGHAGDRRGDRARVDHLDAVRQAGALHVREIQPLRLADRRHGLAGRDRQGLDRRGGRTGGGGLDVRLPLTGIDAHGDDGTRQPRAHGRPHGGGGDGGIGRHLGAVKARIVGVEHAFGQNHGLAAEAAGRLQRLHALRQLAGDHARDLVFRRPGGDEVRDDGVQPARDRVDVLPRLHVHSDLEQADALERQHAGADRDGALVAAHQFVVQTRAGQAAQHRAGDVQIGRRRVEHAGHHPGAVQAGVRDAVLQRQVDPLRDGRHVGFGGVVLGPARDVAEIALDQRPGGRHVDVAGQHQHGVVRAVLVAMPVTQVLQRGGVQIGHRADGGMAIGVACREQGVQHGVEDEAVRLVVALTLLVLDDAALVIQPLLGQRTQQVTHAVALHVERLLQRRRRHRLEEVGAVEPGRAVPVGGPHGAQGLHQTARHVLGRIEQADVLEQMGEARPALGLVLGADVVPGVDRHDRGLAVGVDDDAQAVVEGEDVVVQHHAAGQFRRRRRLLRLRRGGRGGGGEDGGRGHRGHESHQAHVSPSPTGGCSPHLTWR